MIKAKPIVRLTGVTELAKELGVRPEHISRVAHGVRKSKRIEAELKKYGIKIQKTRRAKS